MIPVQAGTQVPGEEDVSQVDVSAGEIQPVPERAVDLHLVQHRAAPHAEQGEAGGGPTAEAHPRVLDPHVLQDAGRVLHQAAAVELGAAGAELLRAEAGGAGVAVIEDREPIQHQPTPAPRALHRSLAGEDDWLDASAAHVHVPGAGHDEGAAGGAVPLDEGAGLHGEGGAGSHDDVALQFVDGVAVERSAAGQQSAQRHRAGARAPARHRLARDGPVVAHRLVGDLHGVENGDIEAAIGVPARRDGIGGFPEAREVGGGDIARDHVVPVGLGQQRPVADGQVGHRGGIEHVDRGIQRHVTEDRPLPREVRPALLHQPEERPPVLQGPGADILGHRYGCLRERQAGRTVQRDPLRRHRLLELVVESRYPAGLEHLEPQVAGAGRKPRQPQARDPEPAIGCGRMIDEHEGVARQRLAQIAQGARVEVKRALHPGQVAAIGPAYHWNKGQGIPRPGLPAAHRDADLQRLRHRSRTRGIGVGGAPERKGGGQQAEAEPAWSVTGRGHGPRPS